MALFELFAIGKNKKQHKYPTEWRNMNKQWYVQKMKIKIFWDNLKNEKIFTLKYKVEITQNYTYHLILTM